MGETSTGDVPVVNATSDREHRRSLGRSSASRRDKLVSALLAFTSLAIVSAVAVVVVSLSVRSNGANSPLADASNSSIIGAKTQIDPYEGVMANKTDPAGSSEGGDAAIAPSSGNASDFLVAERGFVLRGRSSPSAFDATDCPTGEGLWNLVLTTDDYPWETRWELRVRDVAGLERGFLLASGPPEGSNYERRTTYAGSLCLPTGRYVMRWFDAMGDGLCCKHGPGGWSVRVNGKVLLENDPEFARRDFPFRVRSSAGGMEGTFYMPRGNVEFPDGTIFRLINLPTDFDPVKRGLVSGITSIVLPRGAELFSNGTANMKGREPRLSGDRLLEHSRHRDATETTYYSRSRRGRQERGGSNLHASDRRRRSSKFEGERTVLVVRVIAADGATTADETALSESIFGDGADRHNLVSQFKACSNGKLNLIKASVGPNGVVTVRLPSVTTSRGDGAMRNAINAELNKMFGADTPRKLADFVLYCLPPGTFTDGSISPIAYAYYNGWLSVFNDGWCSSLSLQMHEVGHNMNFGHSNEGGERYEDLSGYMGASYRQEDGPLECFNAAKSWQAGWYRDKGVTINSSGANTCFKGILHGVTDYPIATTVLLKVQNGSVDDYYVNFNARKGINRGTQEGGDKVMVASRPRGPRDSFAESELVAKLGSGGSYAFRGYRVFVGKIDKKAGTAEVTVLPTGQDDCDLIP